MEPPHDKTNKMTCALSEDSDQTGRMPRLIRVFAGCTCHFVGFVMRRLKYPIHYRLVKMVMRLTSGAPSQCWIGGCMEISWSQLQHCFLGTTSAKSIFSQSSWIWLLSSTAFSLIQRTYLVLSVDEMWTEKQTAVLSEFDSQPVVVLGKPVSGTTSYANFAFKGPHIISSGTALTLKHVFEYKIFNKILLPVSEQWENSKWCIVCKGKTLAC